MQLLPGDLRLVEHEELSDSASFSLEAPSLKMLDAMEAQQRMPHEGVRARRTPYTLIAAVAAALVLGLMGWMQ